MKNKLITATTLGLFAAITLTACSGDPLNQNFTPTSSTPTPIATPQTAPATAAKPNPTIADFRITLTTTTKQCIGEAGCILTVEPNMSYGGNTNSLTGKTCRITYDITGGAEGTVTNTLRVTNDKFTIPGSVIKTASTKATLSATITGVTC